MFVILLEGPAPCWLVSAVVKGGKAQKNGKKGFLGGVRHENPYKDCHAALGRWLVRRYTIEQVESVTSQQCNALSGMCHLAQQPARLLS